MAKRNDDATRLPKRIGGVSVPKRLRRSSVVNWMVNSDLLREIVASAIIAGVAALWRNDDLRRRLGKAAKAARRTAKRA